MDKLKFINEQMSVLAIPYEFGEWTSDVRYPYWVGEIAETEPFTEDGAEESTLILTGFYRGDSVLVLEQDKQKIRKHFHSIHGLRGQTESGVIAVFYGGAFYVPTNEASLKRMQINLRILEWKGDL